MEALPASSRREQFIRLDAQYAALQATFAQKHSEIARLTADIASLALERARFAPVYTLPDDVLFEIIKHAYTHNFPHCREETNTLSNSPITFTHVSRRFRQVALAVPTIWTCVHVTPYQNSTYHRMLDLQLERSQALPLSVTFMCNTDSVELNDEMIDDQARYITDFAYWERHFQTCWGTVVSSIHRMRRLAFLARHGDIISALLDGMLSMLTSDPVSMPRMEYLELYLHDMADAYTAEVNLMAPRLSDLRLYNVYFSQLSTPAAFKNLSKLVLTHWNIGHGSAPNLNEVFSALGESLETLVMNNASATYTSIPFNLPQLRYLILKDMNNMPSWTDFMHKVSAGAPKLSQLKIFSEHSRHLSWDHRFTTPVFGAVRELVLFIRAERSSLRSSENFSPFFSAFPSVKHIRITGENAPSYLTILLEPWKPHSSSGPATTMCPSLEKLTYSSFRLNNADDKDLLPKLVEYRTAIGSPIKELVVDEALTGRFTPQEIEVLEKHVKEMIFCDLQSNCQYWDGDDDTPSKARIDI